MKGFDNAVGIDQVVYKVVLPHVLYHRFKIVFPI